MSIKEIQKLVLEELNKTEQLMLKEMQSKVPLANLVMQYALGSAGKRLRTLLVLLSANLCNCQNENPITASAFIEFIHNATLLHDDVIDQSDMRRGKPSANAVFHNSASILVGDFLYTRAFQMMIKVGNPAVLKTMADAVNLISEGEIMQLANAKNVELSQEEYYEVIELKTAVLFSAACKVAGQISQVSEEKIKALADFGKFLGMAFQIIDDVLDYTGDEAKIGKSLGDDLAEGKPTLPLIRAKEQLNAKDKNRLIEIIKNGEREAIFEVITLLNKTDALQYSKKKALEFALIAKGKLHLFTDNMYKQGLINLVDLSVNREN